MEGIELKLAQKFSENMSVIWSTMGICGFIEDQIEDKSIQKLKFLKHAINELILESDNNSDLKD